MSRSTVKIKVEHANVDQQLQFQRLLTVRERCDDVTSQFPLNSVLTLLLCFNHDLSLCKAVLADFLCESMKEGQRNPSGDVQYVLDGSGLLHRVPWPRGSTSESVSHFYVRYVAQKYGAVAIVFDGYTDYIRHPKMPLI